MSLQFHITANFCSDVGSDGIQMKPMTRTVLNANGLHAADTSYDTWFP